MACVRMKFEIGRQKYKKTVHYIIAVTEKVQQLKSNQVKNQSTLSIYMVYWLKAQGSVVSPFLHLCVCRQ